MAKISIIVPMYNEETNIRQTVDSLLSLRKRMKWNCEIVLVDDNSRDRTGEIAESYSKKNKGIIVIHRSKDGGMGNALIAGTKKSKGSILIWTMGDGSDEISTFPKLVDKINSGYDLVVGSRYMKGGSSGDLAKFKALMSWGYTLLSRLVFGIKLHDITNAFRAFRRETFEKTKLESPEFGIAPEFAIKAHLKKFRLGEVPTTYSNRVSGQAKFKLMKMGITYVKLFKYRFTGF